MSIVRDLTGMRFGKLLVLERDYEKQKQTSRRDTYWKCQCDCGNITTIIRNCLTKENGQKSCGHCIERETIGKKFGELTVIKYNGLLRGPGKYNTESRFLCQCSCGNLIEVSYDHLSSGHTCSCGCIKSSYGEKKISEILENSEYSFKREYTFSQLKGINGGLLRYDFAIFKDEKLIRLVEFDGPQHNKDMNYFGDFEAIQEHDKRKNNYALKNNIPLVRIPYSERSKITLETIFGNKFLVEKR